MSQDLNNQVIKLLQNRQKIEAVKLVKDTLSLGLKESKDYVDALESGQTPFYNVSNDLSKTSTDLIAEVKQMLNQGIKIEAVKLVKEKLGLGLKEAKDFVDDIENGQNPTVSSSTLTSSDNLQAIDSEEFVQKIYHLLYKNQKIEAVKLVVDAQGLGLREAKEYVDKIERLMSQG